MMTYNALDSIGKAWQQNLRVYDVCCNNNKIIQLGCPCMHQSIWLSCTANVLTLLNCGCAAWLGTVHYFVRWDWNIATLVVLGQQAFPTSTSVSQSLTLSEVVPQRLSHSRTTKNGQLESRFPCKVNSWTCEQGRPPVEPPENIRLWFHVQIIQVIRQETCIKSVLFLDPPFWEPRSFHYEIY
jgi:hypothetical protein